MGTHIQDFATFSSKLKEMKSIKEEQEKSAKQEEYAQFFKKTLQKYGVSSPAELKDDAEKKAFFNEIDKGWSPEKGLTSAGEETMNESFHGPDGKPIGVDSKHMPIKKLTESEISSDKEFREYAETVLKNMHGEEYDQTKADDVINDLLSKKEGDDYGALIGMLNKGN
jgi:hypothetical protein